MFKRYNQFFWFDVPAVENLLFNHTAYVDLSTSRLCSSKNHVGLKQGLIAKN